MRMVYPSLLTKLVVAVSALLTMVVFIVVSPHNLYALVYVTFLLFAAPWTFPLLLCASLLALASARLVHASPENVLLTLQSFTVLALAVSGRLVRCPASGSLRNRVQLLAGGSLRIAYAGVVAFLVVESLLLRTAPLIHNAAWTLTLVSFLFAIRWPVPARGATRRERTLNFVLLFVSVSISLAGLEIAVRLILKAPVVDQPGKGAIVSHPDYLWTLKPGANFEHAMALEGNGRNEFWVDVSSQGLRDREFPPKKPGEYRIAIVGDSMTMGWGLSTDKVLSRALENELRARNLNREVTVMNMGVVGFGPWQERLFFLERGLPLQPDMVLLQLFPRNDVQNTLTRTGEYLDSFNFGWEELVLYWRFHADWRMQAEWWLRTHCHLYHHLKLITGSRFDLNLLLRNVRFLEPVQMPELPPMGPRPFHMEFMLEDWYPNLKKGWDMMQDDIRSFAQDCRKRNIEFACFCLPSPNEISDAAWNEALASAKGLARYERLKDVRLCEEFCAAEGIPFANIANGLVIKGEGDIDYYLPDGVHYNEKGNQLVGKILADYVVNQRLQNAGIRPIEASQHQ